MADWISPTPFDGDNAAEHSTATTLATPQHPVSDESPEIVRNIPPRSPSRRPIQEHNLQRLERRRSSSTRRRQAGQRKARVQAKLNRSVDLRLLDYVSTYDDNLMCPICRCPFIDPVMVVDCDHYFCWDCIRQCWSGDPASTPLAPRGDCPTCRTPAKLGPRTATSKILVNIIGELMVKCPNHGDGCTAEVKRGEVADHVKIYCGYALIECLTAGCARHVLRKDQARGCLHHPASCLECRGEMEQWELEMHWRDECIDREVDCSFCKERLLYRQLDEHYRSTCPANIISCLGHSLGCTARGIRTDMNGHARDCTLAKLAPVLAAQQRRFDDQEASQKHINRKLGVLESGFTALRDILYSSRPRNRHEASTDEAHHEALPASDMSDQAAPSASYMGDPHATRLGVPAATPANDTHMGISTAAPHTAASAPYQDFPDLPTFIGSTTSHGAPYDSPLHHLLSMHEALRDEFSRMSAALADLDARHSMQILNENLRVREEVSYLSAQVGALQRHVHWLTSAQLQRLPGGGRVGSSNSGPAGPADATAAGVEGVVGAVSSAATAIRGAARMVGMGQQGQGQGQDTGGGAVRELGMRRRLSEEGRTKL